MRLFIEAKYSWEDRYPGFLGGSPQKLMIIYASTAEAFSSFYPHAIMVFILMSVDQEDLSVSYLAEKSQWFSKLVSPGPWIAWFTRDQAATDLVWTDYNSFRIAQWELNKASSFQIQKGSLHYKHLLPKTKSLIWKDPKHDNISNMISTNFDAVTLPQNWDKQESRHWFLPYLLFCDQALKK